MRGGDFLFIFLGPSSHVSEPGYMNIHIAHAQYPCYRTLYSAVIADSFETYAVTFAIHALAHRIRCQEILIIWFSSLIFAANTRKSSGYHAAMIITFGPEVLLVSISDRTQFC